MTGALLAEWTKLRTSRATVWLLLGVVAATVGISAASCAITHVSGITAGGDSTKLSLVGVYLGQIVAATLAITIVAEEHATGMCAITFVATPTRLSVLVAKAANLTCLVAPAGAAAVAGCLAVGRALLPEAGVDPAHGYALVSVANAATTSAAAGSVIYLVLVALLSLGIATILKDTAVALTVVFGLLFLPEILAHIVGGNLGRHIEQVSPMTAGLSIQATTRLHSLAIAPWTGLAVCSAWSAASLLAAGVLLGKRDV